jgi:hypothetical protein
MGDVTTVTMIGFRGRAIPTVKDAAGVVRVAVRPIVEAMGLAWGSQYNRLMRCPVLGPSVFIMKTETGDGERASVTIPLDMLNGFLFGIDAGKVKPEIRETVIAYQRECYRALADYWMGGGRVRGQLSERAQARAWSELRRVADRWARGSNPALRRLDYARLCDLCVMLGQEPPAPDEGDAGDAALAERFWVAVDAAMAAGILNNHHRQPEMLAFRRAELEAAFTALKVDIRLNTRLKAALMTGPRVFDRVTGVNGRYQAKTVHCWVFRPDLPAPAPLAALPA